MWHLPLLIAQININWFLIPLVIVISLVYSASRYEHPERVVRHAAGCFGRIMLFMIVVFAILLALSHRL